MTINRLEKSTSPLLLEPDWDSVLKICDLIRQGDVPYVFLVSFYTRFIVDC